MHSEKVFLWIVGSRLAGRHTVCKLQDEEPRMSVGLWHTSRDLIQFFKVS